MWRCMLWQWIWHILSDIIFDEFWCSYSLCRIWFKGCIHRMWRYTSRIMWRYMSHIYMIWYTLQNLTWFLYPSNGTIQVTMYVMMWQYILWRIFSHNIWQHMWQIDVFIYPQQKLIWGLYLLNVVWRVLMGHDSFIRVTWRIAGHISIHTWFCIYTCDVTGSYMTGLIQMGHDSFIRVTWYLHLCLWRDSFVRDRTHLDGTWLVGNITWDMTYRLIQMGHDMGHDVMTPSDGTWLVDVIWLVEMGIDSLICVTWLIAGRILIRTRHFTMESCL